MISGINVLTSSNTHHQNANKGDCYFNTIEQRIYCYDGRNWLCLTSANDSSDYLLQQRLNKINKIHSIIKNKNH